MVYYYCEEYFCITHCLIFTVDVLCLCHYQGC